MYQPLLLFSHLRYYTYCYWVLFVHSSPISAAVAAVGGIVAPNAFISFSILFSFTLFRSFLILCCVCESMPPWSNMVSSSFSILFRFSISVLRLLLLLLLPLLLSIIVENVFDLGYMCVQNGYKVCILLPFRKKMNNEFSKRKKIKSKKQSQ